MRVFITGGTGFVGRNVLAWLITHRPDWDLTCLVRDESKARGQWPDAMARRIIWQTGDLLQPETYRKVAREAQAVLHMAALVSLKNGPEFYKTNTDATRRLAEVLQGASRLQRLVFISSISAVDRPLDRLAVGPLTEESPSHPNTDYGRSKLRAEQCIQASGLPYTILRPAYIYGAYPRLGSSVDRLVRDVQAGHPYTRFPFPGRVSVIEAGDLAEMTAIAAVHAETENQVFFIGHPEPVRVADAFAAIARELGIDDRPRAVPSERITRYQRLLYRRYPDRLPLRIMFEDSFWCSPAKWQAHTGHAARTDLADGVRRTLDYYARHGLLGSPA